MIHHLHFQTVALAALFSFSRALYYRDVTADNFDSLIDSSKASILLEFYAPWCGHCKNLAPEYEQLGKAFERTSDVIIAQVNADTHKSLGQRFKVEGFPTLKWIPKDVSVEKAEDVSAGRTAEELIKFVNGKTGHSKKIKAVESNVFTLTNENFKNTVLDSSSVALVGFFAPWCGHCKAIKPTWEKLASLYADEEKVTIGALDCDAYGDLAKEYKVEGFPTIKFFGQGTAEAEDYTGGRELADLVTFINEKGHSDISPDGGVIPTGGVVEEIADHVKSYIKASTDEERKNVIDTCKETVENLNENSQSNFKYYAKVFAKIAEKGKEYVNKEKERLSKLLEAGENSLKVKQRRSFMRRINVLNVFDEL